MIDIIVWVVLALLAFSVTFCCCVQACVLSPILCSNECCGGTIKDEENQEMDVMPQPQPTQQPMVGQPQQQQQIMIPMPPICVMPINGGPNSEPADASAGRDVNNVAEPPPTSCALVFRVLKDPRKLGARAVCSLVLAYLIGMLIIFILIAGRMAANPFPAVKSDTCNSSAACKANAVMCCDYDTTLVSEREEVWLDVLPHTRIHGWWMPACADAAGNRGRSTPQTLLYNHGSCCNLAVNYRIARYRFLTKELGLNVFVYDYPGYGKSTGVASEASILASARAAQAWVLEKAFPESQSTAELLVLGRSMGSGVAVALSQEAVPPFKGLVLQSAFTTYRDAFLFGAQMPILGWVGAATWPYFDSVRRIALVESLSLSLSLCLSLAHARARTHARARSLSLSLSLNAHTHTHRSSRASFSSIVRPMSTSPTQWARNCGMPRDLTPGARSGSRTTRHCMMTR